MDAGGEGPVTLAFPSALSHESCEELKASGLPEAMAALGAAAAVLTGAGRGCDARFNGEPVNHAFYDLQKQWDESNRIEIADARKQWGLT
jgi:hypothetical protein